MKKTALITGCNRGLGKTLMNAFAADGYDIIAMVRNMDSGFEETVKALQQQGTDVIPVCVELTDRMALQKALQDILAMERPIDVLINNAGINVSKPIFYTEYEEIERSFQVNYFAPFLLMKEISGLMVRQGYGNIINISSVTSLVTMPAGAAYNASKAALNYLTMSGAQELAQFGVRVNAIACGVINSDMFAELKPEVQKKNLKRVAVKRTAEYSEITNTALFLCSDKASYITGQVIRVDGGYV
jgi:3-oxoacyl-[acyl-carrier protein] reductase